MKARTKTSPFWRRDRREWATFLAFVAPNALLFGAFTFWPILYSVWLSFTDWDLLRPTNRFVGLANYIELFYDSGFWRVLFNTAVYTISVVVLGQILAFLLAILLNVPLRGQRLFRTIAFLPHVTMTAAAALVWVLLLHPQYGPLSALYAYAGIAGPNLLVSSTLALFAVILVGVWKETAFASLLFLAGLQNLPRDCYEAASIEGAGPIARLRHLTLPLMTPTIFFLAVTGFIQATKAFDAVAIMTEGGPVYPSSSMYVYHLYVLAFREYRAGFASAFAVVFFLISVGVIIAQFRYAARRVHYGE
ncbi:MAG TPA: sugar ABC transporter permease [Candidatus Hydrogenedentes bacterium]|nr:sugar ABC transporter permease [Candidatus Hydrogenedentota bacterium]